MEEIVFIQMPVTELNTDKYTEVFHEADFKYNAPHHFRVVNKEGAILTEVHMQEGPILEVGVNGCCNEDLLNMVVERLECFQDSKFACRENQDALDAINHALTVLHERTNKRNVRGVEGTYAV